MTTRAATASGIPAGWPTPSAGWCCNTSRRRGPGRPDPPSAARPSRPGAQRHNVDQGRGVTILSGSALHIFDGLRGADEVAFALKALPLARFAVLNAPDVVRVERLLQRQDAFDQVSRPARGQVIRPRQRRQPRAPRPQATAVSDSGGPVSLGRGDGGARPSLHRPSRTVWPSW